MVEQVPGDNFSLTDFQFAASPRASLLPLYLFSKPNKNPRPHFLPQSTARLIPSYRKMAFEDDEHERVGGEEEEAHLQSLLEASRTPEGRSRLAGTLAPLLLRRLSPSSPPRILLLRLRLLRNLCAGDVANQGAFLESDGAGAVAAAILRSPPDPTAEIRRAGLQLLGNAALGGEPHRGAVWTRLFPAGFLELARVREPGVCDPLCMVLDTCCSSVGGRGRLEELCGTAAGIAIIVEIVTTASQGVGAS